MSNPEVEMSCMLRDRPDGQFEIVLSRPMLVGIFPERDVASRVMFFLQEDELEMVEDAPALFGRARDDVAEAFEAADIGPVEIVRPAIASRAMPAAVKPAKPNLLPAVVDKPQAARQLAVCVKLTDEAATTAFARIAGGEKIATVAPDFFLSFNQMRGMWAAHCRRLQQHMAAGGKVPCGMCKEPFTPSLSHRDTCARCSRD
jgi:hypothetical protein